MNDAAILKDLDEIKMLLYLILWIGLSVIFIKALFSLGNSMGESSYHAWRASRSSDTRNPRNEGSPDFTWVGHDAEEAYREKHWGSYIAVKRGEEERRIEDEVRRRTHR